MEKMSPYHMYLIRKLCTTLGSISKEALYDIKSLGWTRFKAHAVVEDETRILVIVVPVADVRLSNAIMSDVNGNLQPFQPRIKCSKELQYMLAIK